MVAPKVAKPQTKAAADTNSGLELQRSTLVARSFGRSTVEQAYMLQRSIGNQATLRLLSQRDLSPTGKELGDDRQPETAPEPPDRASRAQPSSPLAAAPLAGAVQAKLVVGDVNDPLEHEADRVADLVMRMDDSEPSMSAIPLQVSRKCAAYEDETKTVRSKRAELANPAAGEA